MRALFMKNIIILMFFLSVGLTIFTLMVMELGFDRAFVVPLLRMRDEFVGGWVVFGLAFGWAMGASDQVRGLTDYVQHRGFSKARLFCTEQALAGLVLLLILIVPWMVLAIGGGQLYEPDYLGIGGRWFAASSLLLPSYGIGLFLARFPIHFAIRMALTIPMVYWIIGDSPDRAIEGSIYSEPLAYAAGNIALTIALFVGSYLSTISGSDRDLPKRSAVIFPVILLLVGSGWALHALSSAAMAEVTHRVDEIFIATKPDGSYAVGRTIQSDLTDHYDHWEVDPATNEPTVKNGELSYIKEVSPRSGAAFEDAGSTHRRARLNRDGSFWKAQAFLEFGGGSILHLTQLDHYSGLKRTLDKGGKPFSGEARMLGSNDVNALPEFWVGDPSDGTLWYADFAKSDPSYVQMELPEGAQFERWLQPHASPLRNGNQELRVVLNSLDERNFAHIQTDKGYYQLQLDSREVTPLTVAQEQTIADWEAATQIGAVHTTQHGLLFHRKQILDFEGKAIFTYDFAPRTTGERFTAAKAALLSFVNPPILNPKAFGNITHAQRSYRSYNGYGVDPMRDPIRYASMQALSKARVRWTDYSPWSAIAWVLLIGLAYLDRRYLVRIGAKGSRLWLWPLAVLAFGPIAILLQSVMEPKRAFLAAQPNQKGTGLLIGEQETSNEWTAAGDPA